MNVDNKVFWDTLVMMFFASESVQLTDGFKNSWNWSRTPHKNTTIKYTRSTHPPSSEVYNRFIFLCFGVCVG